MTTRRKILLGLGFGTLSVAIPSLAQQSGKVPRVAFLAVGSPKSTGALFDKFKKGLRDLGYIEGMNIVIEVRWAEGKEERLSGLAAELIALKPDVLVGNAVAIRAIKQLTKTIPIVVTKFADPVGSGWIASLAHPGGNITGMSSVGDLDMALKQVQLLRVVAPKATRIANLWWARPDPARQLQMIKELQDRAKTLGVTIFPVRANTLDEFNAAFAMIAKLEATALIVGDFPVFYFHSKEIAALAAAKRLPAIYPSGEYVEAGGLLSYGVNNEYFSEYAATYVDKILKGAKPGDLPVEQATRFELVVNMKTAKALGITIPQEILLRADEVIERQHGEKYWLVLG